MLSTLGLHKIIRIGPKMFNKLVELIKPFIIIPSRSINGLQAIRRFSGIVLVICSRLFVSIYFRPRFAEDVNLEPRFRDDQRSTVILIQGPLGKEKKFFLETLKLYRDFFSSSNVLVLPILWTSDRAAVEPSIYKYVDDCLFLDLPHENGIFNVDLQTYAISKGIEFAQKKGAVYALKTRTDCRIYDPDAISFLKSILSAFPLEDRETQEAVNFPQTRIIASSLITGFHRIYGLTDLLLFGCIADIALYFDPEKHSSWCESNRVDINAPLIEGSPVVSEIFLCARYLNVIGEELKWTKEHWHKCLAKYFCIVDSESIDLFWKKYEWQFGQRFHRGYADRNGRMARFSDWLQIYTEATSSNTSDFREVWKKTSKFIKQERVL